MAKAKKITVRFNRTDESGNIYHVVALAVRGLNDAGKQDQARELKQRVWKADDYEAALKTIGEYVKLTEIKNKRR